MNSLWNPTARIAKNSLVQLIGGTLNKLLGVALVIYAARQLGPQGFGQYSFILSLYAIFYLFADFGLGTLATRDLARDPSQEAAYLGNIFSLRLLLSGLTCLGMVGATLGLGQPAAILRLTWIVGLSFFFTSNVDTCTAVFNARQRMEIPATLSVAANTLRVSASLGALAAGEGVEVLLWIHTLAAAVHFFLLLRMLGSVTRLRFRMESARWLELLRQAYPLALANLFSAVYFRVDSILLASLGTQQAVGWYNAAYRLLEFTMIVPAYYGGAVFPVISESFQGNPPRFMLIYRRSLKYMGLLSLPMAAGAMALAPNMIQVLYGSGYLPSVPVLRILMGTLVLIALNSLSVPYLIVMGRQRIVTWLILISMSVNLLLNLWVIPRFGMMGAAWVTLGAEALNLGMFFGVLAGPLQLDAKSFQNLLKPIAAAGLMYGVLRMILDWDLGYQIALGGMVYGTLLFLFKAFDEVDVELFRRVLRPTESGGRKVT